MVNVSRAQVLSANRPDFRANINLQGSVGPDVAIVNSIYIYIYVEKLEDRDGRILFKQTNFLMYFHAKLKVDKKKNF